MSDRAGLLATRPRGVDPTPLAPFAFGAGSIHVWAAVGHRSESAILAVALLALGVAQLALGWLLLRRVNRALLAWSAVLSITIAAVWAATRTMHLALLKGTPEAVGLPDVAASVLELAFAAGVIVAVMRPALVRSSTLAWGLSAALATTPLAPAAHGSAGAHVEVHPFVHAGLIAGACGAFGRVLVREARAGRLGFSMRLRER